MNRRALLQALMAGPVLSRAGTAETELRVAVNRTTIESAPLLVQKIPGVQVVPVSNGRIASAQLVAGMVDAATGSETQALLNSVAQPDLRIVLTLAECRYRMVARTSAGIRTVADLRGKRVATTPNTSAQYFLADMLHRAHLREADVRVVPMEGPAMRGALSNREVDAIAIWEPHAENARQALGADARVLEDASVYRERFNLNTTARALNDPARHHLLVTLVQAVRRVSAQLQNSPQQFLPELANSVATPERIVTAVWSQFRFPASLDAAGLRALLADMEPWAAGIAQRKVRSPQTLDAIVDSSVWDEARSQ